MKICMGCMEYYDEEFDICPHCGYVEGTPTENSLHIAPGEILADRYIIGKVIGYGGFGVTYIGWDALLETKVAIKEYLPSEFSTRMAGKTEVTVFSGDKKQQFNDGMNKFVEEARKLAQFQSTPGIVKVFDSFECNNTAYIIMELLEGETLAERIKREKKIPEDEAISIMKPIIESLSLVHKHGIIHRDIAPDNVFLTNDGKAKLIDFGAARFATTSHSRSLTVIIKPGYSPEEQYRSRGDQGTYTDVYAVGATLYKMITGETPPDALERRAFFENKRKDILAPLSKFEKDISDNHETAILNALNVKIEDRTQTMEEFLSELESEEPVKRKAGRIKKIDILKWPLWAKIAAPVAGVAIITFAILFITGVIGFNANLKRDIIIPEGQTRVPSVINNDYQQSEEKLTKAKLLLEVQGKIDSTKIPENLVLSQSVSGGSVVPENTLVGITISAGISKQIVPNVVGMDYNEAKTKLEELGFRVSKTESFDSVIAKDCVITQSLKADSEEPLNSEIVLTVSKGRNPDEKIEEKEVTVPNFVGMKYSDVVAKAKEMDISIEVSDRKYSKDYEKDTIMSQSPNAESKMSNTQSVKIVVSLGYSKVSVPDVVFLSESKAEQQLEGKGLKCSVSYESSETVASGLVISQNPSANSSVNPESTVSIVVSTGAPAFSMPNVVGKSESTAKSELQGKGLSVTVSYKKDSSKSEGTVLSQSISASSSVKRGDSVTITVCVHDSTIEVPNVVGKTQSEAESLIKSKGLKANVVEVYNNSVATGKVVSQSPSASVGLHSGDYVTINVSLGKTPDTNPVVTIPDIQPITQTKPQTIFPEAISLNKSSYRMEVGEAFTLIATVSPNNSNDKSVVWSSSDSSVASVSGGKVTGNKQGTATITAKTHNRKIATCSFTIVDAWELVISQKSTTLNLGETYQINYELKSKSGKSSAPTDWKEKVHWSSSDDSIASIDRYGKITAKSVGKTDIKWDYRFDFYGNSFSGEGTVFYVTVKSPRIEPESIDISPYREITLTVGDSYNLYATVSPSNAQNKTVNWSSSNPSSIGVDSNGTITAYKAGQSATITAKVANGTVNGITCQRTVDTVSRADVLSNSKLFGYSLNYDGSYYTVPFSINEPSYSTYYHDEEMYFRMYLDSELVQGARLNMYIVYSDGVRRWTDTQYRTLGKEDHVGNNYYVPLSGYLKYYNGPVRLYTEIILPNGQVIKPANQGTDDALYIYIE